MIWTSQSLGIMKSPWNGSAWASSPLSQLTTLVRSLGGSLWVPGVSNYEDSFSSGAVAGGVVDAAENDDWIGYVGDLTTYNGPENGVPNSAMIGVTPSAPGTGWSMNGSIGLTVVVVGTGAVDGETYVDYRVSGTSVAADSYPGIFPHLYYSASGWMAMRPSELVSSQIKASIAPGSAGNPPRNSNLQVSIATAAGTFVTNISSSVALTTTHTKFQSTVVSANTTVARASLGLVTNVKSTDGPVDFTIRVSHPQLERGRPRDYVRTTGTAISRGTFNPAYQTTTASKPQVRGTPLNWLVATATLSTQNVTCSATPYTLSFTGTGSVTLSGTGSGTLNGTGASDRVYLTFTPTQGTVTFTVTGSVTLAMLNLGSNALPYVSTTSIPLSQDSAPRWWQFAGDGTANDYFSTPIQTPATGYFACAAMFLGGSGTSRTLGGSGNTTTAAGFSIYRRSSISDMAVYLSDGSGQNAPTSGITVADGVPAVMSFAYSANTQAWRITSGGSTSTANTSVAINPASVNPINIGRNYNADIGYMNGFIGPVVWIPAAVTAAQDLRIRQLIGQMQQIPGVV